MKNKKGHTKNGTFLGTPKKGQAHISETIAVIFIFFILILFGILFYGQYQKRAIQDKQEELLSVRAMDTTLRTLFLPELQCTKGEAEPEENCFDLMKLRYANQVFGSHLKDYYFDLFSYSTIVVQPVYPRGNAITLYNVSKPNATIGTEKTFFVVTLRDETQTGLEQYGYGYVTVEVSS